MAQIHTACVLRVEQRPEEDPVDTPVTKAKVILADFWCGPHTGC